MLKVESKTSDSNDVANTFTFKKNSEQKFDFENEKTKKKQKEINTLSKESNFKFINPPKEMEENFIRFEKFLNEDLQNSMNQLI